MNRKFKYDQYEISINFRNDTCLWVCVQFSPTQEVFLKDDVELTRIKKDTVVATLERKSEKNLRCQLEQIITEDQKYLVMAFIVNFDYLPEFREQIKLDFVEKKDKLQSISVNNFQSEIEQMEEVLNSFKSNGLLIHKQQAALSNIGVGQEVWQQSLSKGKYLLKVSGIFTNSSGATGLNMITFNMSIPGAENQKAVCTSYNQSGYSYPICFSELIEAEKEGNLVINANANMPNATLTNTHFTLSPVFEMI